MARLKAAEYLAVARALERLLPPIRMARSPIGGIQIAGTFYPGGQFIPGEELEKATPEQKRTINRASIGIEPKPTPVAKPKEIAKTFAETATDTTGPRKDLAVGTAVKVGDSVTGHYKTGVAGVNFRGSITSIRNDEAGGGFATARVQLDHPTDVNYPGDARESLLVQLDNRHRVVKGGMVGESKEEVIETQDTATRVKGFPLRLKGIVDFKVDPGLVESVAAPLDIERVESWVKTLEQYRGHTLPPISVQDAGFFEWNDVGGEPAVFWPREDGGQIAINHDYRLDEKKAKEQYDKKWWSSPSPVHVIHHEVAHALHMQAVGGYKGLRDEYRKLFTNDQIAVANKVSEYASTHPIEFVEIVHIRPYSAY